MTIAPTSEKTSENSTVFLWGLDTPVLYTAAVELRTGGRGSAPADTAPATAAPADDTVSVAFGIRTISFTAGAGFVLNGVPTILKGGCVHHDNGILGSV